MEQNQTIERLLTPQQVADLLQVKLQRVYEAVASGRIRAFRVGRLLRFRYRDLEAYLSRVATVR